MSALLVVLAVAAADRESQITLAIRNEIEVALDAPGSVVVVGDDDVTTRDDEVLFADIVGARAVADVRFADPAHTQATIAIHGVGRSWVRRDLTFPPVEPLIDRGRTIGLLIASTFATERQLLELPANAPTEVAAAPAPTPPPSDRPTRHRASTSSAGATWFIDLGGRASSGLGGAAGGLGGTLALHRLLSGGLWLRAGIGARAGSVAAAGASSSMQHAEVGVSTWMTSFGLDLGVRADVMLMRHAVTRWTPRTGTHTESRLLPGFALTLEASLPIASAAAVVASAGLESGLGRTEIAVGESTVTDIPLLRLAVGLSFRIRL